MFLHRGIRTIQILIQRSAARTSIISHLIPSDESLGYWQTCASRTRDLTKIPVRVSGRMRIAHRFVGGVEDCFYSESLKRTDDVFRFSGPLRGLAIACIDTPSDESLGYCQSSVSRTMFPYSSSPR